MFGEVDFLLAKCVHQKDGLFDFDIHVDSLSVLRHLHKDLEILSRSYLFLTHPMATFMKGYD